MYCRNAGIVLTDERETIHTLKHMFDSKYELIAFLQGLNVRVPARSSYSQILGIIRESGSEEKFAQAVFHTKDLESGIQIADVMQGLSTLTLWEVKILGSELSSKERNWTFRKTPKKAVVDAIAKH